MVTAARIAALAAALSTTLATALGARIAETGSTVRVLHQDDYYHLSPAENDARRRADSSWRGPKEVDLARLEADNHVMVVDGTLFLV